MSKYLNNLVVGIDVASEFSFAVHRLKKVAMPLFFNAPSMDA